MNLPNALTVFRIALIPVLLALLLARHPLPARELLAAFVMLAAGISDGLDGYLARRRGQVTTLGTLLDPVADKLLISAALIALVEMRAVQAWMAVIIIGREFAVSGLRNIASARGLTIAASPLAKAKMVTQVVCVIVILVALRFEVLRPLGKLALWTVVGFALVSAGEYFYRFWGRLEAPEAAVPRRPEADVVRTPGVHSESPVK